MAIGGATPIPESKNKRKQRKTKTKGTVSSIDHALRPHERAYSPEQSTRALNIAGLCPSLTKLLRRVNGDSLRSSQWLCFFAWFITVVRQHKSKHHRVFQNTNRVSTAFLAPTHLALVIAPVNYSRRPNSTALDASLTTSL